MMVFSLMVLHVFGGAFDHSARGVHASWPPLGAALAGFLSGTGLSQGTLEAGYRGVWWLHYLVILGFMVYIPRSKHLHILASFANAFFKPLGPKVVIEPISLEALEAPEGRRPLAYRRFRTLNGRTYSTFMPVPCVAGAMLTVLPSLLARLSRPERSFIT